MSSSRYDGFLTDAITERMESFPTVGVKVVYTKIPGADFVVAAFLSQVAFYCTMPASRKASGWAFVRHRTLEEIGLSRKQQDRASAILIDLRILEKRLLGMPAKIHYRVNWSVLDRVLLDVLAPQEEDPEPEEGDNQACPKGTTKDEPNGQPSLTERDTQREAAERGTKEIVPKGTSGNASHSPRVKGFDPFGLDIPRIKEETFHLADQLARKAGITPLNHKPTKRAQIVQNALEALKAGRFMMWAQIHKPWILETGLPVDELPPVEDPIAFLSKALEAHNAAVNVGSRLTADNLADFFITKSADGWIYSPMWRFLHQGFQTTSPVSTILRAEILARPDGEATLKAIDRRRTNDGNQNPPTEPCVLRRARALLVWLAEKRPILDTHYTAVRPREYTNEKAFLQSIFQWMDEVGQQDGSSWIPDVNEPVSMARFTHWFHERYAINLNIKEPRKETPKAQATKSVTHKALWEQGEKPL